MKLKIIIDGAKQNARGAAKGISPLIATVLLIAFTVAVAAIVSTWMTTFTTTSTETVSSKANTELYCTYGGIAMSSLAYNTTSGSLSGIVENTRLVSLGNITLQVFYRNATSRTIRLNKSTGGLMSLDPRERDTFSISSIDSNYDKFHMYTNCSTVYDDASSGDVTSSA